MARKRGLVTCPSCGSAKVEKALMAPSLGRGTKKGSSEMIAVPPAPPTVRPGAAGKPVVTVLDGAMSIAWTAPATGGAVGDYVVQRATSAAGPYMVVTSGSCASHPLTATTCTVTGE